MSVDKPVTPVKISFANLLPPWLTYHALIYVEQTQDNYIVLIIYPLLVLKIVFYAKSIFSKSFFGTPHNGQTQSSGRSSNLVPGEMPAFLSPTSGL